jgi:hypothetical protein
MGVGSQSHAPGKFRYPQFRRLGGHQDRSGRVREISPPPGFDPRNRPTRSDWAIPAQHRRVLDQRSVISVEEPHRRMCYCEWTQGGSPLTSWLLCLHSWSGVRISLYGCIRVFFRVTFCSCRDLPRVQTPTQRPQDSISQNRTSNSHFAFLLCPQPVAMPKLFPSPKPLVRLWRPTQATVQRVPGFLPRRHLPSSSAEIKGVKS